ncbi:expansin-A16 [Lolium perenne]|uniref:expansin-A16 n=1 Tax=Lolium perenne TaxID=4522 RepID=UPI0021F67C1D|nr:expansin-A16-like [Lolium perenne]
MMSSLLLLLLLLPLLVSGVRFGGGERLGGNGDYEDWRLGTATYIKESQGHPLNDGGGACGYADLDIFRYGRYTAGLSGALFDKGSACGGCYELRCVNNILWCLRGSPTVVVTATDFCPPNFGLADDFGGWCNFPKEHLEMTEAAFLRVAKAKADIVQVQFRRVSCDRAGGIRFTITGGANFLQVLITNVAADGEVAAVKVKGSKTGWIPMGRNWGQNWQCDADFRGQPLSFEVTGGKGRTITMYNVAPSDWMFAQTFAGKQFVQ